MLAMPLFRVPPFPRARHCELMQPGKGQAGALGDQQIGELIELTRMSRVGGTFWGSQPELPDKPYALVRVRDAEARSNLLRSIGGEQAVLLWFEAPADALSSSSGENANVVTGCCDPWHLLGGAERVYADAADELALIASIAGVPVRSVGTGSFGALDEGGSSQSALLEIFRTAVVEPYGFVSPFGGESLSPDKAIELCAFWRNLVDKNRGIAAALGFATWKRSTIEPLLWAGSAPVAFASSPRGDPAGRSVAVWKSRVDTGRLAALERTGSPLVEVEDGFIRSVGLGADCVPPLSIVVDHLGIYFDPGRESDLERLLQDGGFAADLLDRAKAMRELIVSQGVSK